MKSKSYAFTSIKRRNFDVERKKSDDNTNDLITKRSKADNSKRIKPWYYPPRTEFDHAVNTNKTVKLVKGF